MMLFLLDSILLLILLGYRTSYPEVLDIYLRVFFLSSENKLRIISLDRIH